MNLNLRIGRLALLLVLSWTMTISAGTIVTIEPDDYPDRTVLNNIHPAVVLRTASSSNNPVFNVTANNDGLASTGERVFGHSNIPFFLDFRRLRMDFPTPVETVSIDFISSGSGGENFGRLDIFDAGENLLDTYNTLGLLSGEIETMSLSRPQGDISLAVAYIPDGLGNFGRLDNLSFAVTPEPSSILLAVMGVLGVLGYTWRTRGGLDSRT